MLGCWAVSARGLSALGLRKRARVPGATQGLGCPASPGPQTRGASLPVVSVPGQVPVPPQVDTVGRRQGTATPLPL